MTELVVDRLEAVDVTEEDGDVVPGALGLQQGVVEVVEQQPPVGQPVSESWNVCRASCSSNALRSEMSRNTITAPAGDPPPTTGEAVMVTGKCDPSIRVNRVS